MLERIQYKNHLGEVLDFGQNGMFVNANDLRDFVWSYTSKNNRISAFKRGIGKKTLPVKIACASEEEGTAKRNALFEVAEKDVLANQHGKIIIGDYYMKCFIVGSKKSDYLTGKRYIVVKLSIATDFPAWVKETKKTFRSMNSAVATGGAGSNLDFPHDYPMDYASEFANHRIINDDFVATNFQMIIYGPCSDPKVYIGGHEYGVATEIGNGEYLVIDSVAKTIELVRTNGAKVNCFNHRSRESYVFEKIPSGENTVTWEGDFGFDMTLLEERSEPKWT